MREIAQQLFSSLRNQVKNTIGTAAEVAEAMGAPQQATSLLQRLSGKPPGSMEGSHVAPDPNQARAEPEAAPTQEVAEVTARGEAPVFPPAPVEAPAGAVEPAAADASPAPESATAAPARKARRKEMSADKDVSGRVRPLKVDDAINNSTYLARIIWSLGVADLEGIAPLRPAEIARMIMARSPVSLEPPNVARYIRRSKPKYLEVARKEGSSSFYELNEAGRKLFEDKYLIA